MGEMADWINDCGEIEDLLYGPGGSITCRCCGQTNLHWEQEDSRKYRLYDELGQKHNCHVNPITRA